MTTLLNALAPMMTAQNTKLTLDVTNAATPGELQVIVRPLVGPVSDKASEELRQLKAALAQPIKVVGTPEDIEATLAQAIQEQAPKRAVWANRAAELDAAIAAAAAKDIKASKSKATASKTTASTTATQPANSEPSAAVDASEANDAPADETSAGFSL